MLRTTSPTLNPAVLAAAELFTDGQITDAVLRQVASMQGLPLHVAPAPAVLPTDAEKAARLVAECEAEVRTDRRAFQGACRELGEANRRTLPPMWKGATPTVLSAQRMRERKADAMRFLNNRRANLRRAERELAAARAALALLAH